MKAKEFICKKKHIVYTQKNIHTVNKGDIVPYLWMFNSHTFIFEINGDIHEETYDESEFLEYWREYTPRIKAQKKQRSRQEIIDWQKAYYQRNKEKIKERQRQKYNEDKKTN